MAAFFTRVRLAQQAFSSIPKLARGFAAPAVNDKPVQVPLTLFGLEGRYATALYKAAAKKNNLEAVENELKKVKTIIKKDKTFFEDPSLGVAVKKARVAELLKQDKYSDITTSFFAVLAENRRLAQAEKIIHSYLTLMTAYRAEVPVTIISAQQLDQKQLNTLTNTLKKSKLVSPEHKLIITNRVDPSILGGLIVEFGTEKTIDLSVTSKINKLNKLLTDPV
ncbi:hypothetical protein G9A89_010545 [Geosiphon pyriformis]|nr:hypothetical protein G9A89_010545 [Geosiphon pyriformis]